MNERTGTGITPERTGLSELEKRQDEGSSYGSSEAGGLGSSGYEGSSAEMPPSDTSGSSFGSGTVVPEGGSEGYRSSSSSESESAGEHLQRVRSMASGRISRTLESRKSFLASELESFAGIFDDVGRTLEERGRGSQKKVADAAAKWTRDVSRNLRDRSSGELIESVRGELKNRPAVVFAGALALGFLGARFLRD
jgi:hypothetical protein